MPYGEISYLCRVLEYDHKTIGRGLAELDELESARPVDRNRKAGGGRKRTLERIEGNDEICLMLLEDYTAGDPMREQVLWTNLTYQTGLCHCCRNAEDGRLGKSDGEVILEAFLKQGDRVLSAPEKPCGSYLMIFYRVGIAELFLQISNVREGI